MFVLMNALNASNALNVLIDILKVILGTYAIVKIVIKLVCFLEPEAGSSNSPQVKIRPDSVDYRLSNYDAVKNWLLNLQKNKVKIRNDLFDYVTIIKEENAPIREILLNCGWLPLDPYYHDKSEWLEAEMDFSDDAINKAMEAFKIAGNRKWCYFLAKDFEWMLTEHFLG